MVQLIFSLFLLSRILISPPLLFLRIHTFHPFFSFPFPSFLSLLPFFFSFLPVPFRSTPFPFSLQYSSQLTSDLLWSPLFFAALLGCPLQCTAVFPSLSLVSAFFWSSFMLTPLVFSALLFSTLLYTFLLSFTLLCALHFSSRLFSFLLFFFSSLLYSLVRDHFKVFLGEGDNHQRGSCIESNWENLIFRGPSSAFFCFAILLSAHL